jgi:hypothetical protein
MKFGLCLTSLILAIYGATVVHAAQSISSSQPVFNFGTIPQGKKVEHVFIVNNSGDMPLTIKSIRPSCGCTAANASSSVIQPWKSSEITVTFNSANFSGAIHKTIALETNDPKVPVYILTLNGSVIEEIAVNPRQINLGALKLGSTKDMIVTVDNNGKRPLTLLSVKSLLSQINVKLDKSVIRPGESTMIHVAASPSNGDRMLSGYLSITTDNPARTEIIVPVYGSIVK